MIQHDTKYTGIAAILKVAHRTGNIIGSVQCHFFSGRNDQNFLCISLTDRCRKTATDHIAQYVIQHHIRLIVFEQFHIFQKLECCNNASTCTAKSRCRSAGLDTEDSSITFLRDLCQLIRFLIFLPHIIHHRAKRLAAKQIDRRIRLRITSDLNDTFSHVCKSGCQIRSHCGLSDTALSVNRYL